MSTIWCKLFESKEELTDFAIKFSIDNNIVESKDWANLTVETGLMGGQTREHFSHTEVTKAKISAANTNPSQATRNKMSEAKKGKTPHNKGIAMDSSQKELLSLLNKGKNEGISYIQRYGEDRAAEIMLKKRGNVPWHAGKTGVWTEEANRSRSLLNKGKIGPNLGKIFSTETRNRMSKSSKGKPKKRLMCVVCGNMFAPNTLKRWHNEKCKHG